MRFAALFLLLVALAAAQTPPDRGAFLKAAGEKEPARKVEALEKFLKEFASSQMAGQARREIVTTLVKSDAAAAVKRTKKLTKGMAAADAVMLERALATALIAEKKLPEEAVKAARRAVKKAPAQGGGKAQFEETLGQALMGAGKEGEAKGAFERALRANPGLGAAATALADAAEKAGAASEALELRAQAMLGRSSPETREKFAAAWAKAPAAADKEAWLDGIYRKRFPNPIAHKAYAKPAGRSGRTVLAEIYTGAGCPPCAGADLAFDVVLERYSRGDVVFVAYHEHIPRPDPMANADTIARWKWQGGRGVPTYAIDGKVIDYGGGSRNEAAAIEAKIDEAIGKQLVAGEGAKLQLKAAQSGGVVTVEVAAAGVKAPADAVLTLVLVEKEIRYSGENGIRFHPMVARAIAQYPMAGAAELSKRHEFKVSEVQAAIEKHIAEFEKHDERHNKDGKFRFYEKRSEVNGAHLAVVAYVQDAKTKEVLQSAYVEAGR